MNILPGSFAIALLAFTSVAALGQSTAENQPPPRGNLKQFVREAHTPEQYQTLGLYFRSQQKTFNDKATLEKEEWDRRKASAFGVALKYPTPADSARNLYQYYSYKAGEMATQASTYERRAR